VRANVLELVDAVHALGLLLGVDEAAECIAELVAARPVGHAAQARAVPVDLARLGVECALLVRLSLESLDAAVGCGLRLGVRGGGGGGARGLLFLSPLCVKLSLYGAALLALGGDGFDRGKLLGLGFCRGEHVDGF
jgi:hypothetical protein